MDKCGKNIIWKGDDFNEDKEQDYQESYCDAEGVISKDGKMAGAVPKVNVRPVMWVRILLRITIACF